MADRSAARRTHSGLAWRRGVAVIAWALLLVGCEGPVAPSNFIELKNDTASPAHVEYAYAPGLFGGPIGAAMSKFDVPAHQTLPVGATFESTTLHIKVEGRTIDQPITPAGPCDAVLVELLADGGTRVSDVPDERACAVPSPLGP